MSSPPPYTLRSHRYVSVKDSEEFPALVPSSKNRCDIKVKSFRDILKQENTNHDDLNKTESESNDVYLKRLSSIFKKTSSLIKTHSIYICKHKNRKYRVVARHEMIARMLCQTRDDRYNKRMRAESYKRFHRNTLDKMNESQDEWDTVMVRVNRNPCMVNEAIRILYDETHAQFCNTIDHQWIDPSNSTVVDTGEKITCREKILF